MPDTKSETPLTDHEAFDWSAVARGEAPPMPAEVVYAGFARGLETRLAAAERELAALRADIAEHNAGCAESCAAQRVAGRCDGFTSRNRQCPDCPRDWMIAEPGAQGA